MPTILRRLPFYHDSSTLRIPNGPAVEIKHHQIIVWCPLAIQQLRLPLLGMSALRRNRLRLLVNGEKKQVSLRAPQVR
jgi:hypothetical protein